MSFAAGFGAGMGAGIATGIATGTSSGKKQAYREIREYVETNGITIHDSAGKDLHVEAFLSDAGTEASCCAQEKSGVKIVLIGLLLLGVLALGVTMFFMLR